MTNGILESRHRPRESQGFCSIRGAGAGIDDWGAYLINAPGEAMKQVFKSGYESVWKIILELKRDTEDGRLITSVYTDCFRSRVEVTLELNPPVKLANRTFSEFGSETSPLSRSAQKASKVAHHQIREWDRERSAPLLKSELIRREAARNQKAAEDEDIRRNYLKHLQ
jgi:hypothetical protein